MNKGFKRFLSLLLSVALLSVITSCGGEDYSDKILSCASFISEYTVERKYVEIVNMSVNSCPELRECLSMSTDSSTTFRPQLAIEATLQYDVLEDTLELYRSDNKGTIDVSFTYCDYEEVLASSPIFLTMEDFEEAVETCPDTIETVITLEFLYTDGIVKLVNIQDLVELFPYKDIEVPLSLGYSEYVDEPNFMGSGFDEQYGCYNVTDCIIANIPITGDGNLLVWDYYYEIKCGFDVIYTSEAEHFEYPELLHLDYEHGSSIPNGTYTVSFYDLEGEKFTEFNVYVIGDMDPIRYIGGTSLYYEIPSGYFYSDPNVVDMDDRFGALQYAVEAYITSLNPDEYGYGYDMIIADDYYVYSDDAVDRYLNGIEDYLTESYAEYEDANATIHPVNYTFTIDGTVIDSRTYYIECDGNYYDIYFFETMFEYEGEMIRIIIWTDSMDDITALLSGFHFG